LNFSLEWAIRKVQENKQVLELNGTHQILILADNLLVEKVNIRRKETLLVAT
jgi:hypothetical protein